MSSSAGYELPLLLFAGFRSIIDELHVELARRGHQDMRPAHGFAMQALGFSGATATEVGRRLGISKQAAGKTVERLEAIGYVERAGDGAVLARIEEARRRLAADGLLDESRKRPLPFWPRRIGLICGREAAARLGCKRVDRALVGDVQPLDAEVKDGDDGAADGLKTEMDLAGAEGDAVAAGSDD